MNSYVNPKLYAQACDDPLLGRGVFASAKILKGEIIHIAEGRILLNSEIALLPLQHAQLCYDIGGDRALCPLDFENPTIDFMINHSCNPNCGSADDILTLVAMRDIKAGEEVTYDYAMTDDDMNSRYNVRCLCGSLNCRKVITGNDWMIPELQERYRGYFQKNIQAKIDALNECAG